MKHFALEFVVDAVVGDLLSQHHEIFDGIGTDTRVSLKNKIFIALKGENFDAHDFLARAVEQEATALIVHDLTPEVEELRKRLTIILVNNTLLAMQKLATADRKRINSKVVGIAGSNGKTTSKDFCGALLSAKYKVHASAGSFNNHWGVPLTLLSQPLATEIAIVEMGMNHSEELADLARIAHPDIVVVTYVGIEHLEFFGHLDKVAEAEQEIYDHAPAQATRIYNLDNPYTLAMSQKHQQKFPESTALCFSSVDRTAYVFLTVTEMSLKSLKLAGTIGGTSGSAEVAVFGAHNVTNLMVAASVALCAGMDPAEIWKNLSRCKTHWGRNQLLQTQSGAEILFDGYNANPDSMTVMLENLAKMSFTGQKIAVFADMLELGDKSPEFHFSLGKQAATAGFEAIWFIGKFAEQFSAGLQAAKFQKSSYISNVYEESLALKLGSMLKKGDLAIVKGSRGMKLERFVMSCHPLNFSLNKN